MRSEHSSLWCSLLLTLALFTITKSQSELNMNDILRTDLMPSSFLLTGEEAFENGSGEEINETNDTVRFTNGTVDAALMMMSFHRKMMNEYLCRGFLAEKILSEVESPIPQSSRRLGRPFDTPGTTTTNGTPGRPFEPSVQDKAWRNQERPGFLADEGSAGYKDWLSKVATLEDIYRNHGTSITGADNHIDQQPEESHRHEPPESREGYEVYEGAEGVGFSAPQLGLPASHKYSGGYEYSAPSPPYHQPSSPPYEYDVEGGSRHGLGLGDLFEISLTGLAFLSFGMFVLQVLMCISMSKPQMTTMQMVDGIGDTVTIDENIRFRRWAPPPPPTFAPRALNELSRRALRALRPLPAPTCLHNALCRGNSYSRNLTDGGRFWLPVWYLAVSWVQQGATVSGLRASALGLGGADCDDIYPTQQC